MNAAYAAAIALLLSVLTLASYIERLYLEMGRFRAGEFQSNVELWEREIEPRLRLSRERISISAALWVRLSLALLTLLFGALLFESSSALDRPSVAEIAQVILGIVLVVILFNQLLPFILFARTRGLWVSRLRGPILLLLYVMFPVALLLSFLLSIASLAETVEKEEAEDANDAAVDALIEAGTEEGIIEQSDRDLVRSAVEFGDKVVRDVMTPRPSIFAVPASLTIEEFILLLKDHSYSRVPVYSGSLDSIDGIAFAHDLIQIPDEDARVRTVASIRRAAAFVPETKRVNELLREMQREKQHMQIVIDEYGGVAGLVTIEDLLEELVGSIKDEHEQEDESQTSRETGGAWLVPGILELGQLKNLFGEDYALEKSYQAATVGGLVSEVAGRIPQPGEVVAAGPLRFEVVASTNTRIERLRVSRVEESSNPARGVRAEPKGC